MFQVVQKYTRKQDSRQREREKEKEGGEGGASIFRYVKNADLPLARENSLYKCICAVRSRVGRSFFENNGNLSSRLTTGIAEKVQT